MRSQWAEVGSQRGRGEVGRWGENGIMPSDVTVTRQWYNAEPKSHPSRCTKTAAEMRWTAMESTSDGRRFFI